MSLATVLHVVYTIPMFDFSHELRKRGLRVTKPRLAVVHALEKQKRPVSIADVYAAVRKAMNQSTAYRAVEDLERVGLVRRVDFRHEHAHYELAGDDHHHIICKQCGKSEDITNCGGKRLERDVLKKSGFAKIESHSMEFYGLCKRCART